MSELPIHPTSEQRFTKPGTPGACMICGGIDVHGPDCDSVGQVLTMRKVGTLPTDAEIWTLPRASSMCPHCGKNTPHQHFLDRKGNAS